MSRANRGRVDSPVGAEGSEVSPEEEVPGLPPGVTFEELRPDEPVAPAAALAEAAVTEEAEPPKRYVVAPGRGLTVPRGELREGATLRPTDLSAEQVADLVKSGHLVAK